MTPIATLFTARFAVAATIALATFASANSAQAVGLRTKMACAGDYFKHCSQYSPGSQEVRQCFRSVGAGLSKGCVQALVADGEVSTAEVNKRRLQSQTAAR
jgi:hypothetical protein